MTPIFQPRIYLLHLLFSFSQILQQFPAVQFIHNLVQRWSRFFKHLRITLFPGMKLLIYTLFFPSPAAHSYFFPSFLQMKAPKWCCELRGQSSVCRNDCEGFRGLLGRIYIDSPLKGKVIGNIAFLKLKQTKVPITRSATFILHWLFLIKTT